MAKVMWLLPLLAGWYAYFSLEGGGGWLAFLIVASIVIGLLIRSSWKKVFAANNVVAAAERFHSMSAEDRKLVHDHACEILQRCGFSNFAHPDLSRPVVRFGWYALSMAELQMAPRILIDAWSLVRNPFIAISHTDGELRGALYLAEKAGFSATLESVAEEAAKFEHGKTGV